MDNSCGSANGGQPCGGRCNFFVPCVPYCARRDASSCWRCFSGFPRTSSLVRLRRTKRDSFYRTALLYVVPLPCAAYYRSVSASECRSDGQESSFCVETTRRFVYHRDFNVQNELRPRQARRCNVGKQVYTLPILIMHRAIILRLAWSRVVVTYTCKYFHYLNDGAQ